MNAPVNIPTPIIAPTLDGLLIRATRDHGLLIDMAYSASMDDAKALRLASTALQGAIDDWCDDNDADAEDILPALRDGALAALISTGWAAREVKAEQDRAAWIANRSNAWLDRADFYHSNREAV
jgi:hypothetical protein